MPQVSPIGVVFLLVAVLGSVVGTVFYLFWPMAAVVIAIAMRKGVKVMLDARQEPPLVPADRPISYSTLYMYTVIPTWLLTTYVKFSDFILLTWLELIGLMIEVMMKTRIRYSLVSSHEGLAASHSRMPITSNERCQPMLDEFFRCDPKSNAQRAAYYAETLKVNQSQKTAGSLGVRPVAKQFTILVVSHRTTLDWMFAWCFLARVRPVLSTIRFVLKASLAKVPWIGWCCQMLRFMFLTRKWETDEAQMMRVIEGLKYAPGDDRVTLLIFPEGTDSSPVHVEQSREFAAKNGLPQYLYVLNPRTTGLVGIKNMIGAENIELIVDMTVGYRENKPGKTTAPSDTAANTMPREVHFLCERFVFAENKMISSAYNSVANTAPLVPPPTVIPSFDDGFKSWILSRFELKERDFSTFFSEAPVDFVPNQIERVEYREVRGSGGKETDSRRRVLCSTDPHAATFRSSVAARIRTVVLSEVGVLHYALLPLALYVVPMVYILLYKMVYQGLFWGFLYCVMSVQTYLPTHSFTIDPDRFCSEWQLEHVLILVLWMWTLLTVFVFLKVFGGNKRFVSDHRTFDNCCLYGPHGLPLPQARP